MRSPPLPQTLSLTQENPKGDAPRPEKWAHRVGYLTIKLALSIVLFAALPPPSTRRQDDSTGSLLAIGCVLSVTTAIFFLVQGSDPGYLNEDVMRRSAVHMTDEDAQLLTTEEEEDGDLEIEAQSLELGSPASSIRSPAQRKDAERNYRLWRVEQLQAALHKMGSTKDDTKNGEDGDALVPRGRAATSENLVVSGNKLQSLCEECGIFPPLRSHHCRTCGCCVATFDHHCFVLGTCIGERNHGRFWWYLLAQTVEICVGLIVTSSRFRPSTATATWAQRNGLAILIMTVLLTLLAFVGALLVFHTFLAMTSMTTFEFGHGSERLEYLRGFQITITMTSLVIAVLLLLARAVTPSLAVKVAPNQFLGKCLTAEWVDQIETQLGVSASERDAHGRKTHPHLHAALKYARFRVNDPRMQTTPLDQLYRPGCTDGDYIFYGKGASVDPGTGEVVDRGHVPGTLVIELKRWASHALATDVISILAQEVVGYNVSIFETSDGNLLSQRMSSVYSGLCTPVHLNVEVWTTSDTKYTNESFNAGGIGYFGRAGLFTTTKFVKDGTDPSKYNPTFDADFWRDYSVNEALMQAADIRAFKNNSKYYPPTEKSCEDGRLGCLNDCSKNDACTAREAQNKSCLVLVDMYSYYEDGYFQAVLANNRIPAYSCYIGYDATQNYALEAYDNNIPVMFYHFEPDPFHFMHGGKFSRIFLPRTRPDLSALHTYKFGEHGYGGKTDNPVAVDYPFTKLIKQSINLLQDHPLMGALVSRMALGELDINQLLQNYINITENQGMKPIVADDPYFSAACQWVRDNYPVWRLWLERLPLAATVFYIFLALALLVCTALVMAMMLVPKVLRLHDKATDATITTTHRGASSSNHSSESVDAESAGSSKPKKKKLSMVRIPRRATKAHVTPVQAFSSNSSHKAKRAEDTELDADGAAEIAKSFKPKRTNASTKRAYSSKVNVMVQWLSTKYAQVVDAQGHLQLPLPKEAVLGFFGHLSGPAHHLLVVNEEQYVLLARYFQPSLSLDARERFETKLARLEKKLAEASLLANYAKVVAAVDEMAQQGHLETVDESGVEQMSKLKSYPVK
ncbi:hypothetical protein P43SY_005060 [Pythium insidiosum]|uniref:protein S-acyltransferase n=1 Tax=Pythium insidiosum TaxID=114742 RepID=A0AAD5QCX1_PYTIN|nr:hypothetical protein P43SY_005060 [Pythium insidiosum]